MFDTLTLVDWLFASAVVGSVFYLLAMVRQAIHVRRLRREGTDHRLDRPATARELHEHVLEEAKSRAELVRMILAGDEHLARAIGEDAREREALERLVVKGDVHLTAELERVERVTRDLHQMPGSTRLAPAGQVIEAYRRKLVQAELATETALTSRASSERAVYAAASNLGRGVDLGPDDAVRLLPERVRELRAERDGLVLARDLAARKAEIQAATLTAVREVLVRFVHLRDVYPNGVVTTPPIPFRAATMDEFVRGVELLGETSDERATRLTIAQESLDQAWTIIANAFGGDWSMAPEEWRRAAETWRDERWINPPTKIIEQGEAKS